jgi:ParB-like chromosome segregation protein Spo0J
MCIFWNRGKKILILGGHHRVAGATNAGIATVQGYVIEFDDAEVLHYLASVLNSIHGREESVEDRVLKAMYLLNRGHSIAKLARDFNLPEVMIKDAIRTDKLRIKLVDAVPDVAMMPKNAALALAQLDGQDTVLELAARVVTGLKLTERQTSDLVADVKTASTEGKKIDAIHTFNERYRAGELRTKMRDLQRKLEQIDTPSQIGAVDLKPFKKMSAAIKTKLTSLF